MALSEELGGRVAYFDETPPPELVDLVYRINTKSGFREISVGLGLPMPEGQAATSFRDLEDVCRNMLRRHEKIIVKLDRSSNGYGNLVLSQSDLPDPGCHLAGHIAAFREQPDRFMVEEFLTFVALPSVEMTVQSDGSRFDYICDQRVEPKAGMATPPEGLGEQTIADLEKAGTIFGAWLHGQGYRGVFDVDGGCLADGTMIFTETNVRRTAGSHLQDIARRLLGPAHPRDRVWISGNVSLPRPKSLVQLESILEKMELFYDEANRKGTIFPVDHVGGARCNYQIFCRLHGRSTGDGAAAPQGGRPMNVPPTSESRIRPGTWNKGQRVERKQAILNRAFAQGVIGPGTTATAFMDFDGLAETVNRLRHAFPSCWRHRFAVKANPLVAVLRELSAFGLEMEAASAGEIAVCKVAGVPKTKISFNSPVKTEQEIRDALAGGLPLSIDNVQEFERIARLRAGEDARTFPPAGFRINPQVGAGEIALTSTAHRSSKFGYPIEEIGARERLVALLPGSPLADVPACSHRLPGRALRANGREHRSGAGSCPRHQPRRVQAVDCGNQYRRWPADPL